MTYWINHYDNFAQRQIGKTYFFWTNWANEMNRRFKKKKIKKNKKKGKK